MENWTKKIPQNPEVDFQERLSKCRNMKEKTNLVNGKKHHLAKWNPLQSILFWGACEYKTMIQALLQNGADPNARSKAGMNFFQLYLVLLHYDPKYQNEESFNYFLDILKLGFHPNIIIFSPNRALYVLDLLYALRQKPVLSNQFLATRLRNKRYFSYTPLSVEHYNTLCLLILCMGGKHHKTFQHEYLKMTFNNVDRYLYIVFFKQYIVQKFKLPEQLDNEEIQARVNFLSRHRKEIQQINSVLEELNTHDVPINADDNEEDHYYNMDFLENYKLQKYEFLPPLSAGQLNLFFHRNFFIQSFLSKENIFTREPISASVLESWLEDMQLHYCFPLTTLDDCLKEYPYLFRENHEHEKKFYQKQFIYFLEEIFSMYNPYNRFPVLEHLKPNQLRYICHQLVHETKLFPKFRKHITNPRLTDICFLIFFYYRKMEKNMNILCYFIEDSIADLKSYEKVKDILNTLDNPSDSSTFFQEYLMRFQEYHPIYMKKFIENMLTIFRYESAG
ncbi:MAG: hypothetical protein CMM15_13310 [Rhodospirillaceae bacterium]|nr:hypothetical protein [Rhodospirillaceae bacterium]